MKKLIFLIFILLVFISLDASAGAAISQTYTFEEPILKPIFMNNQLYHSVIMPGLDSYSPVGEPKLPFKSVKILLPQEVEVNNIKVSLGKEIILPGLYKVEISQQPLPLIPKSELLKRGFSLEFVDIKSELKDLDVYGDIHSDYNIQMMNGYDILTLDIYPVQYNPKDSRLSYFDSMTVIVDYDTRRSGLRKMAAREGLFRDIPEDAERIMKSVDNPSVINTYGPEYTFIESSEPTFWEGLFGLEQDSVGKMAVGDTDVDYIIITSNQFIGLEGEYTFEALAAWKESKGLSTKIVSVEDIYSNYEGIDEQEKIRNFIKDSYLNRNTKYILLGGDADRGDVGGESGDNIVPVRRLWVTSGWDVPDMVSDVYYANLDGNFDYNGNGVYGEYGDGEDGGEVDLYADVYVGRASVDSAEEVSNFVRKTIDYERASLNNENWLRNALMVGEHLGFGGVSQYAKNSKEEVKEGSDKYGYITDEFPSSMNVDILYDKDNYWPESELINKINENNINEINHLGHANVAYVMKLNNPDIDALTNTNPVFVYSQGCYPGSFDNGIAYSDGASNVDSAAEHFTTNPTGAFAVIMNARFGWGAWDSTDGPSQRHDRRFFDELFNGNEQLSKANAYAREGLIGYLSEGNQFMKGIYWETNLLGDPETSMYVPDRLDHDLKLKDIKSVGTPWINEPSEVMVSVKNAGKNSETNINVELRGSNGESVSGNIPNIAPGEKVDLSLDYTFSSFGGQILEAQVDLSLDQNPDNNILFKTLNVPYVRFTDVYEDYGLDEDEDGLYDKLMINIEVESLVEEDFIMTASLLGFENIGIYPEGTEILYHLVEGKQNIILPFSGMRINYMKMDSPYTLRDLIVFNVSEEGWNREIEMQDYREVAYTIEGYSWEDFEEMRDIEVWFDWYTSFKKLLNEPTKIKGIVYNNGGELKEPVRLSLYSLIGDCYGWEEDNCEEELISTKMILPPPSRRSSDFELDWTPNRIGENRLKIVGEITNDFEERNNERTAYFEVSPPSQIMNTGDYNMEGYLILKTQHFVLGFESEEGEWVDDELVINDLEANNKRIIEPGEILDIKKIFNSLDVPAIIYSDCEIPNFCQERVYAALVSSNGDIIETEESILEATSEFWVFSEDVEISEEEKARFVKTMKENKYS